MVIDALAGVFLVVAPAIVSRIFGSLEGEQVEGGAGEDLTRREQGLRVESGGLVQVQAFPNREGHVSREKWCTDAESFWRPRARKHA